ncbi:hypothetical protein EG244_17015 [Falsigemmobacter faecalis]|uniref:Uncharacterized protein n=1 Tax=Falsigemmobacter faecalis TaxID=2488730 RepID=A0A3P3D7Y6_9RHOB|nr:hypothetical protein EG244_17015 [Falsigemmobacter faecalis]
MNCLKQPGQRLMARAFDRQVAEVQIRAFRSLSRTEGLRRLNPKTASQHRARRRPSLFHKAEPVDRLCRSMNAARHCAAHHPAQSCAGSERRRSDQGPKGIRRDRSGCLRSACAI